jgi:flagellar biosynthesis GTPase FlhF
MEILKFTAPSFREAMQKTIEELGVDAVVLSSRNIHKKSNNGRDNTVVEIGACGSPSPGRELYPVKGKNLSSYGMSYP